MESNGKGVSIDGVRLDYPTGEVDFGEPGTNGQHSFYQLIHQGRTIPAEFIGVIKSQQSVYLKNEIVSNHDELMCNFFAQADALAVGKSAVELRSEGCPDSLIPHKTFTGNRPSVSILLPQLDAFTTGQLLSLYENRIAVQGFIWGINSFDQWGVELGKVLATKVRAKMYDARTKGRELEAQDGFNPSTCKMINRYLVRATHGPCCGARCCYGGWPHWLGRENLSLSEEFTGPARLSPICSHSLSHSPSFPRLSPSLCV